MLTLRAHDVPSGIAKLSTVATLAEEVGSACESGRDRMGPRIVAALARAMGAPGLLTLAQRVPSDRCYSRHVVHADPAGRFTILSLVWMPAQFSPPHAHQTWCAYAVYDGTLTETDYALDASTMKASALTTVHRHTGYCTFGHAGLDQIHRLGNAGVRPAISLHVYGVDGDRIRTHVNRMVDVV